MRVMLAELTRINSHLVWLGTHALDIGAMTMFFYCFREREDILRLFEMFSGQRLMTSYIRIGGLALEPPRGWMERALKFIKQFPSRVDQYEDLLNANPIWNIRTKGVGHISLEDMLDLGVTGPMLRGAGLNSDCRKSEPYSSYEKFDFKVCTEQSKTMCGRGTACAWKKCARARKSLRRRIEGMPSGPVTGGRAARGFARPRKDEDPDGSAHLSLQDCHRGVPRSSEGEAYQCDRIAARRNRLLHASATAPQQPYRVHMRTPSFGNLQGLGKLLEGILIADSIAALGSMDFVLGDTDR